VPLGLHKILPAVKEKEVAVCPVTVPHLLVLKFTPEHEDHIISVCHQTLPSEIFTRLWYTAQRKSEIPIIPTNAKNYSTYLLLVNVALVVTGFLITNLKRGASLDLCEMPVSSSGGGSGVVMDTIMLEQNIWPMLEH